ncbi:hypothetical protein NFI96_020643 [Prochilodus magdalenae]|nr:hypothetical protein NFI96_020643 [Prochilodus magdalenae]
MKKDRTRKSDNEATKMKERLQDVETQRENKRVIRIRDKHFLILALLCYRSANTSISTPKTGSSAMAHFGLWMAVLAASFVAAVANSPPVAGGPQPDFSFICRRFSRDGTSLGKGDVFDMVMVNFNQIPDIGTEKVKEFMAFADKDHDDRLSMSECEKLVQHLNELRAANRPEQ